MIHVRKQISLSEPFVLVLREPRVVLDSRRQQCAATTEPCLLDAAPYAKYTRCDGAESGVGTSKLRLDGEDSEIRCDPGDVGRWFRSEKGDLVADAGPRP